MKKFWVILGIVLIFTYIVILGSAAFYPLFLQRKTADFGLMLIPMSFAWIPMLFSKGLLVYSLPLAALAAGGLILKRVYILATVLILLSVIIVYERYHPLYEVSQSAVTSPFMLEEIKQKMEQAKNFEKDYFATPKKIVGVYSHNILMLENDIAVYIPAFTESNRNQMPDQEISEQEIEFIKKYLEENLIGKNIQADLKPEHLKLRETMLKENTRSSIKMYRPTTILIIEDGSPSLNLIDLRKRIPETTSP